MSVAHGLITRLDGSPLALANRGEVFIRADAEGCAYIVASGRVAIREGGRVIDTIEPGELFGEMALIDPEPRSASAVAIGPTELIRLEPPVIERLLATEPGFALGVVRLMT